MVYQVGITPVARKDLREIARYVGQDSPSRAQAFVEHLIREAKRIGESPRKGRVIPDKKELNIREFTVRPYRVIYRIDDDDRRIEILRFWHSSRRAPDLGE